MPDINDPTKNKSKTNEEKEELIAEEVADNEQVTQEPISKEAEMLDAARLEIDHWKNKYLRALADYENLEKRHQEHEMFMQNKIKKHFLTKFLDILDTIYQAEIFVNDPGLKMVKDNFLKILKEEHIEEMDLKGKEYDPYTSEAVDVVEDEKNKNKIIDVLSRGYKMGGEIIRIAKVRVGK